MIVRCIKYKPSKLVGFYDIKNKVICEIILDNDANFYFFKEINSHGIHEKDFNLVEYLDKRVLDIKYNNITSHVRIIFEDDELIIEPFNHTNSHYPHVIKIRLPNDTLIIEVGNFPIDLEEVAKKLNELKSKI